LEADYAAEYAKALKAITSADQRVAFPAADLTIRTDTGSP